MRTPFLRFILWLMVGIFAIPSSSFLSVLTLAKEKGRQKVIDFEGEVVEGLNKRPLDSLSHVGEGDKRRRKNHLYRKRGGFKGETAETLRLVRYQQ